MRALVTDWHNNVERCAVSKFDDTAVFDCRLLNTCELHRGTLKKHCAEFASPALTAKADSLFCDSRISMMLIVFKPISALQIFSAHALNFQPRLDNVIQGGGKIMTLYLKTSSSTLGM